MRFVWIMVPLVVLSGCQPRLPEPEWFGRYVTFATDQPIVPCEGTLPWLDRFVERTYELYDRTPLQEPLTVYYLSDLWEPGFPCPPPENHALTSGCADLFERVAYFQAFDALEHEIVHVVMSDLGGYHDPLFEEGIAEALGSRPADVPPARDDVEAMVGWPRGAVDYTAAGHFVRSIIEHHGPEAFLAFYRDGRAWISREDTRELFELHFGETIEQAAARYRAREHQCFFELSVCDDEPLIPWQGDEWRYKRVPSCADPDVWGFEPLEEDDGPHAFGFFTVGLEIPYDGHYEVTSSVYGILRRCGETCEDLARLKLEVYAWQRLYLRAGHYTLELSPTFGAQDVDVVIRRGPPLTGR